MLARAGIGPGQRVLDIGCGSGLSLRLAADMVGPEGHVTAVDIAPPMVEHAMRNAPGWVEGVVADAQTHRFDPARYDAVVSLFGTMFFADTLAAFMNLLGAVRPGGRLCLAAWGPRVENPWFSTPDRVAAEVLGVTSPSDPAAPGPFRFADAAPVLALLRQAGWTAAVETVDLHLTPPGDAEAVGRLLMRIGPASARIKEEGVEGAAKDALRDAMVEAARDWQTPEGVRVPAKIHYFTALRPA
jgi:SAM-dependent methyltransferase